MLCETGIPLFSFEKNEKVIGSKMWTKPSWIFHHENDQMENEITLRGQV